MRRHSLALALTLISVLLLPTLASAQLSSALGVDTRETRKVEELLAEGKVARAMKLTRQRIEERRASMEVEVTSGENLARLVALEAVILAMRGKKEEALWQWAVAQNLDRGVARRRYGKSYGEAGAFLDRHRLRGPGEAPEKSDAKTVEAFARQAALTEVVHPQVKSQEGWQAPTEPGLGLQRDDTRSAAVEVLVDEAGRPQWPVVLSGARRPGLVYSALDAIRHWKFAPGTLDGKPQGMLITVNIHVPPRAL